MENEKSHSGREYAAAVKLDAAMTRFDEASAALIVAMDDFITRFEKAVAAMPFEFTVKSRPGVGGPG